MIAIGSLILFIGLAGATIGLISYFVNYKCRSQVEPFDRDIRSQQYAYFSSVGIIPV